MLDIFISACEISGDLHGARLAERLLTLRPDLKIGGILGPEMRKLHLEERFRMESLKVMGFIDVFFALPKLVRLFFQIRNHILNENPKAVLLIDYPGFHLRLEKSLRKNGYQGKLIHYICPTVWAWGKKRIKVMSENLDLLLTIFPFEKKCFENTSLNVTYVGHPLTQIIQTKKEIPKEKILAIFPGSRKHEIENNLALQLKVAKSLQKIDPALKIMISKTQYAVDEEGIEVVPFEKRYDLMKEAHLAIATSGTVALELALHQVPTIVTFFIKKLDLFLAQKIFRINLPFYAMPNIIAKKMVFPELFGPNFTEENLEFFAKKLLFDDHYRKNCIYACEKVKEILGSQDASQACAETILSICFEKSKSTILVSTQNDPERAL